MNLPPQITAFIRLVRRDLAAIGARIGEVQRTIQEHAESIDAAQERERQKEPPSDKAKEVRAIVTFDNETKRHADENEQRQRATQKSIKNAAWAAFAAASIYALISAMQWCEMIKATKAANLSADAAQRAANAAEWALKSQQTAFQTDQRPYLVTDGMPQFVMVPNVKSPIIANVVFRDIGKTPAINAVWSLDLLPYRAKTRPGFLGFVETAFTKLRKRHTTTMEQHAAEIRRDISPTATTTFSPEQSRPLLAPEMADLTKGDGSFILLSIGIVNYTDGFKGNYETEFCYFFVGSDPRVWHLCDSHNTIK